MTTNLIPWQKPVLKVIQSKILEQKSFDQN